MREAGHRLTSLVSTSVIQASGSTALSLQVSRATRSSPSSRRRGRGRRRGRSCGYAKLNITATMRSWGLCAVAEARRRGATRGCVRRHRYVRQLHIIRGLAGTASAGRGPVADGRLGGSCSLLSARSFIARSASIYMWVVDGLSWPSHKAITAMSTPDCSKCMAVVCRKVCGEIERASS